MGTNESVDGMDNGGHEKAWQREWWVSEMGWVWLVDIKERGWTEYEYGKHCSSGDCFSNLPGSLIFAAVKPGLFCFETLPCDEAEGSGCLHTYHVSIARHWPRPQVKEACCKSCKHMRS